MISRRKIESKNWGYKLQVYNSALDRRLQIYRHYACEFQIPGVKQRLVGLRESNKISDEARSLQKVTRSVQQ